MEPPNHALQRTAAGHCGCNQRALAAFAELGSFAALVLVSVGFLITLAQVNTKSNKLGSLQF